MEKEKVTKTESEELPIPVSDLPTRVAEYTCGTCGKVSFQSEFLSRHYRVRGNYTIQMNQRFFVYDGPLEDICKCVNVKPYKCEMCPKTFARKGGLKSHCRIHTNEKPYQCELCPRNFRFKVQLETHAITHANKPYKCPVCSKYFMQATAFKRHCRSHKKGKKAKA